MRHLRTRRSEGLESDAPTARDGASSTGAPSADRTRTHEGTPLPPDSRARLESSFGHSLERVRIHDDAASHELATNFDARAFALGPEIFFREGQYRTDTPAGFELLAHETAHTLQSSENQSSPPRAPERVSAPNEANEQAARDAGRIATLGGRASVDPSPAAAGTLHRWPWDDDAPAGGTGGGGSGGGGGGGLWDSITSGASKALDWGNASGKALHDTETSVGNAVSGAYNAVAPDFNKSNQDLGKLVNMGEGWIHGLTKQATDATKDIPVLGSVVSGTAMMADVATDLTGGSLKGAGDLAAMAGNAIFHPIDSAKGMVQGIFGMAEHIPGFPGTMLKGAHGAWDIATGNEKGEYGKDWGELSKHLFDSDQQNKDDLKFWAGLGGGEKAWSENPTDAAARPGVNLLPFLLGEVPGEGPMKGPGGMPEGPLKGGGAPAFEGPGGPKAPVEPPGLKGPVEPPSSGQTPFDRVLGEEPGKPGDVPPSERGNVPEPAPESSGPETPKVDVNLGDELGPETRRYTAEEMKKLQELDRDIGLQDAAGDFADDPRMKKANLTPEEARQLAEDIKNARQRRMQASDGIREDRVDPFRDVDINELKDPNPRHAGSFSRGENPSINLNFENAPEFKTPEGVARSVAHEFEHHIQTERARNPLGAIDPGASAEYAKNILNYIKPEEGMARYMEQLIEREAFGVEDKFWGYIQHLMKK